MTDKLLESYIKCWAQKHIKLDPCISTLNKDLVISCNNFITTNLIYLGYNSAQYKILINIKTIRFHLKNYIKENHELKNINFNYNHHNYGRGIKGISIINIEENEELTIQQIKKNLLLKFKDFYKNKKISKFTFNESYNNEYYEELKGVITELPKYFRPIFQDHSKRWNETYYEEIQKLKNKSNLKWYKKNHKFKTLFPTSYGLNAHYPRYKIYPTYGTIISIPQELRHNILKKLNQHDDNKFYTIDFKACHLAIVTALFKEDAPNCDNLLKNKNCWLNLTQEVEKNLNINKEYYHKHGVSYEHIKIIIKKFFYKQLQGGNTKKTNDIYQSLNHDLKKTISKYFIDIGNSIQDNKCFKEIKVISNKVSQHKIIYTPECIQGYDIKIKRQRISRLTTGIEICLLLNLILVIIKNPVNLIPISLEHDGVLLYGKCENIDEYIKIISKEFKIFNQKLINYNINVELKK